MQQTRPDPDEPQPEDGDDTAEFVRDLEYATRPDWSQAPPTLAWRDQDDTYDYDPSDQE